MPTAADDGVGAPRDDRCPADLAEHAGDGRVALGVDGALQTDEEGVDDVEEWEHCGKPVGEARAELLLLDEELARVAQDDHEARRHAELPGQVGDLLGREIHAEDDLDEKERHREQPVHVAVRLARRAG